MPSKEVCAICKLPDTVFKAGVVDGVYISRRCQVCFGKLTVGRGGNNAAYDREREREEGAHDMVQPYMNGRPNPEFIKAYPKESKMYFTDEEISKAESEIY